jgi:Ferric iron reductase FhuF-like transporter
LTSEYSITPASIVSVGLNASCYSFARLFFAAFLPPMLEDGVAFEAHPQNTVARFSLAAPHELRGFVIRDFGGLRVHPPTLLASTGVTLSIHPGHSIATDTLDDVYTRMYHTMFHNHLQQLVRVLGLHYNGKGWEVIRVRLRESIPPGHALERAWLGEEVRTIPGKCFVRMRMVGAVQNVSCFSLSFSILLFLNEFMASIYINLSPIFCITLELMKNRGRSIRASKSRSRDIPFVQVIVREPHAVDDLVLDPIFCSLQL